jgi:hypothetical protein
MSEDPIEPRLLALLRALAADDAGKGASAIVRTRLLDEVRSLRRQRRRAFVKTVIAGGALTIMTVGLLWYLAAARFPGRSMETREVESSVEEMYTAVFPLPYSTVPMTGGRVVRLAVRPETLARFGLEEHRADDVPSSQVVFADVIVGDDGLARAVRFVRQRTKEISKKEERR